MSIYVSEGVKITKNMQQHTKKAILNSETIRHQNPSIIFLITPALENSLTDDESNRGTCLTRLHHQTQALYFSVLYSTVFPHTRFCHQIQVPANRAMMEGGLTEAKVDANATK